MFWSTQSRELVHKFVNLVNATDHVPLSDFYPHGLWSVIGASARREEVVMESDPENPFPRSSRLRYRPQQEAPLLRHQYHGSMPLSYLRPSSKTEFRRCCFSNLMKSSRQTTASWPSVNHRVGREEDRTSEIPIAYDTEVEWTKRFSLIVPLFLPP